MNEEQIYEFMRLALQEAIQAAKEEEIPVGCVVVKDGKVIASAHNTKEGSKNSLHHAEINAMNLACGAVGEKYLIGCSVFVTLEPCPMCLGAMLAYRIENLYFGAYEPKSGCAGSLYNLGADERFNHRINVTGGVLENECAKVLKDFFAEKRKLAKKTLKGEGDIC